MRKRYLAIFCLLSIGVLSNVYATNRELICPTHLKYYTDVIPKVKDIKGQQYIFAIKPFNEQGISFTGKIQLNAVDKQKAISIAKNLFATAKFKKNLSIAQRTCIYKSRNYPSYNVIIKKQ